MGGDGLTMLHAQLPAVQGGKVCRLCRLRAGGFTEVPLVTVKLNNPLMLNVGPAELDLLRCQTREHRESES